MKQILSGETWSETLAMQLIKHLPPIQSDMTESSPPSHRMFYHSKVAYITKYFQCLHLLGTYDSESHFEEKLNSFVEELGNFTWIACLAFVILYGVREHCIMLLDATPCLLPSTVALLTPEGERRLIHRYQKLECILSTWCRITLL